MTRENSEQMKEHDLSGPENPSDNLFAALQNPETRKGVSVLLEKITPLLQGERFNNIVDLLSLASDGVDMLDDATIQRLMKVYEEGVGAVWAVGNAARYASAAASASSPPSVLGLVKLARQEEVRRGMHFALVALSVIGRQMSDKNLD